MADRNTPSAGMTDNPSAHDPEMPYEEPFHAELNAHGSYNTIHFVLRLSPEVHRILREAGIDDYGLRAFEPTTARAFSTVLHETVHWWQHIGTTYGFMLSLMYPGQSHHNHRHLKALLKSVGFKKSIRQLAASLPQGAMGTPSSTANIIINNHFDLAVFATFTRDAQAAEFISSKGMFDGGGHAFRITFQNVLALLSATFDPGCKVIPNAREWEAEFSTFKTKEVPGFYYGGKVLIWPIGAKEIFEGQARFSQLQYLALGAGGELEWDDFRAAGMLEGVYIAAFNHFLEVTGLPWPETVDHATTALFLVVCDIALNPGNAFPYPLSDDKEIIHIVANPGARFTLMCRAIRQQMPLGSFEVKNYTREEYVALADKLCALTGVPTPIAIAKTFTAWSESGTLAPLMSEYEAYDYLPVNAPIRVVFSHFLAFMRDKHRHPEFFCWPGAWMAGERAGDLAAELMERHGALFVDKEFEEGVFPRFRKGIAEEKIRKVFETFYATNVTYDLTNQWIARSGRFTYDFRWLVGAKPILEVKGYADRHFASLFGVQPDDAELMLDA